MAREDVNGEKSPQIILIILIKLQVRLFKMHVPVVVLLLVITGDKKQVRYRLHMHTFIIPPANEVAGVYSDPYVRPFVRSSVLPSVRPSVPPNL